MKKLTLKNLKLSTKAVLPKEDMKNIVGGLGLDVIDGGGGGCSGVPCYCNGELLGCNLNVNTCYLLCIYG